MGLNGRRTKAETKKGVVRMMVNIEPNIYLVFGIPIIFAIFLTIDYYRSRSRSSGKSVIKNHKVLVISVTAILLLVLTWFLFTINIRSEFNNHLSEKYPGQKFAIGFIAYDLMYGNYGAHVTCLDDHIPFGISKNSYSKQIEDYYSGVKRAELYNSKIKPIFENSDLKNAIVNVSGVGGIITSYKDVEIYDRISLSITAEADMITVATRTIEILKGNNISAGIIDILQEKNKHVYELSLSPADYSLSKIELQAKVEQRK